MFRLLILTSSYPRSDEDETCGYVREFARSLSTDFRVTVLAPPDPRGQEARPADFSLQRSRSPLPARLDPVLASEDLNRLAHASLGVKLCAAPALIAFALSAFRLARHADVICAHWMAPSGLIGALISRSLGKPLIVVEHSGALHLLRDSRAGGLVARFIVSVSERIVTVSDDLKRKLVGLCPEAAAKTDVIPMGVSRKNEILGASLNGGNQGAWSGEGNCGDRGRGGENGLLRVLFIGRLTPVKGLRVLLQAIQELRGAELQVAGDGEDRPTVEGGCSPKVRVRFLGTVGAAEKRRLLEDCDVLVVPSVVLPEGRTEGMPVACLEGMAAGKPIIASRVGGLAEIIVDGYNGLLVDPGDAQMLAGRLEMLAADQELRARLGANARQTAAHFDWSEIGLRFSEILNRATSDYAARQSGPA